MVKIIWRIVCGLMLVFMAVCIFGAVVVTGDGFLDLSNIARGLFIGCAVFFGIMAIITGWKGRNRRTP